MSLKKLIPWNWFKKEEDSGQTIPVQRNMDYDRNYAIGNPIGQLHHEMERLFDRFFHGFGIGRSGYEGLPFPRLTQYLLKPTLDLGATDKAYTVTVEIPGVDEKDIKLEIINDTLTIRGEKKQETEEKDKNFYRLERSYGSFQRMLSLPGDIDQDSVKANFKKGILTVTMPRKALPKADVKQIAVNTA